MSTVTQKETKKVVWSDGSVTFLTKGVQADGKLESYPDTTSLTKEVYEMVQKGE